MESFLSKQEIDSIIRSKRKTIALVVTPEAKLVVRAPYRTSLEYIEKLVNQKQKWIIQKQQAARLRIEAYAPKKAVDGEEFLFLGETFRLLVLQGKRRAELLPGSLVLHVESDEAAMVSLEAWYKKQAVRVFTERTNAYSKLIGLNPKSVSISGARRRWGSCGPQNTLNFAWRLVMAPLQVIDYVIVHELAHIQHKNHSRDFWNRVAEIMPEYKMYRKWLIRNQNLLEIL